MPTQKTLEKFIARVEENAHAEAIQEFYTSNASMQENQSPPRIGRDNHVAREHAIFAKAKSVTSKCIRPAFANGDHVIIRWLFEFQWLDGSTTTMEEIAYQRWDNEQIAEEKFFYDPAQRIPKNPPPFR
jgi:hypothetical protein